jgi:hypothetical protein
MELKDVILSTLAEMEDEVPMVEHTSTTHDFNVQETKNLETKQEPIEEVVEVPQEQTNSLESETLYLNSIRERLLVLFEGFQAPNNVNIEAKVDMTLNFLEYTLATIDSRLEKLEKGTH